jgi:DNA polymerase III subunit alpha
MSTLIKTETKTRDTDLLPKEHIPAYTFSPAALLKMEKEILGIYVSTHPLSIYRQKLSNQTSFRHLCIRSHHIGQLRPGQPVLIAGLLIQIRRQFTKHQKIMAFLLLEDETSLFEAIVFPEVFHRYFSLLVKDALLLIKGNVSNKKGEEKLIIQEIINIHSYLKENTL